MDELVDIDDPKKKKKAKEVKSFGEDVSYAPSKHRVKEVSDWGEDVVTSAPVKKKETEEPSGGDLPIGTESISPSASQLPLTSQEVANNIFSFGKTRKKTAPLPANIVREDEKINKTAFNASRGQLSGQELADLYKNPYSNRAAQQIISQTFPGIQVSGSDDEQWDIIAGGINETNRKKGVAKQDEQITKMDEYLKNTLSKPIKWQLTSKQASGQSNWQNFDVNNPDNYARVIEDIELKGSLLDDEGKEVKGEKEKLLDFLKGRLFFIKSNQPVSEEIEGLSDKIYNSVEGVNLRRQKGVGLLDENYSLTNPVNTQHFKEGLNYIKDAYPARYKNIIRAINDKGQIADTDYEQIAQMGQDIYNEKVFRAGANDPSAIGKETSIDYTGSTYQSQKSDYALRIGEYLKKKGFKNKNNYTPGQIKEAAKAEGLTNSSIVNDLIAEEGITFYDAIPKSGALNALSKGIQQPFQGIKSTFNSWTDSPSETYLKLQQYDVGGGQKVKNEKGEVSEELPSDRGNVWYDAVEGFGQFIPQVILSKGIGSIGAAGARVGAGAIGKGLTAAQAANVSTYGGTFISTYLQEYGSAYEQGLQKTGSPSKARAMGAINGIAAASFELLLPDIKLAENAGKIFRGKYAEDIIDLIKKGGDPADLAKKGRPIIQKFVTQTFDTMRQEVSEEVGTELVDYMTESIFSPQTARDRDLGNELWETAKATAISMSIPSVLGGAGGSLSKDFTESGFNSAAINFEDSKRALDRALMDNNLTQDEYNKTVQLLSTHKQSIQEAPESNVNGSELTAKQKLTYALNDTKVKLYQQRADNATGVTKEMWEEKVKEAQGIQRAIVMPEETEGELAKTPEDIITQKAKEDSLGVYGKMVRDNPAMASEVLRDVAQQAYGINEQGKPLEGGKREGALSLQMGTDVVEAAKLKFPTPESTLQAAQQTQEATPEVKSEIVFPARNDDFVRNREYFSEEEEYKYHKLMDDGKEDDARQMISDKKQQILDSQKQEGDTVKEKPNKSESKFPKPSVPISQMNSEQLREYGKSVKDYSKNVEVEFFGEEGAKKYREARRISNSTTADRDQQKSADATMKEMEDSLTEEQRNEFFGMNAPEGLIYDPAEIGDTSSKVSLIEEAEGVDDIARSLKLPLLSFIKNKNDIGTLAILNAAKNKAAELNISTEELLKESITNIAKDLPDKTDAAFLAGQVLKKLAETSTPVEEVQKELPESSKKITDKPKVRVSAEQAKSAQSIQIFDALKKAEQSKISKKEKSAAVKAESEKYGENGRMASFIHNNFDNIVKQLKDNNKIEVKC